jgi:dihydroorotase
VAATIVRNARIVNEGRIIEGDLAIEAGRIAAIGRVSGAARVEVDAAGAYLLPGMIDDQVHFREPGLEHKGTIATESRAAIAGGITSYLEMPNSQPQTVNAPTLADKHARAARSSAANWGFYLGATNDNLEEIKRVDRQLACGVKVFMGASTGNMLVDREETLEGIFAACPLVIATHCEHTPTIQENERRAVARYGEDIPIEEHPNIRSAEACYRSSKLAVELALRHSARLHVLHLTTAREMELFAPGPIAGKRITGEVCVHHLMFNDTWYRTKGTAIKCNPAIKTTADQQALLAAVADDRIDVIATDHAPHTREEKAREYRHAPSGLPLVQHALSALVDMTAAGLLMIEKVVEKTAHAPAIRFDIAERGFIREGYWADLAIVDPHAYETVADVPVLSKCGWSPFADFTFRGKVRATFVNGEIVYRDGEFTGARAAKALSYARR